MRKHQYLVTFENIEAGLIDRIKFLMSKSELTDEQQSDFDYACDEFRDNMEYILLDQIVPSMVKLYETSMVYWLPVNGTIPPTDGIGYLVTDGQTTWADSWCDEDESWLLGYGTPTHNAEYPVIGK
jgi:hypothetical protein